MTLAMATSKSGWEYKLDQFDFVDFGCSMGGSIEKAARDFGATRGLGIDIDPDKVAATRKQGHDAIEGDLTNLKIGTKKVSFAILSHFLEHLSSLKAAERCLHSAVHLARDFVYVAQPYFDADGYLFSKSLKLYWSDWHGHPNKMTTLDFQCILRDFVHKGLIRDFAIFGYGPIRNIRNKAIHPLCSPMDQGPYDASLHAAKPGRLLPFLQPVFTETRVMIGMTGPSARARYAQHFPKSPCLFDSTD